MNLLPGELPVYEPILPGDDSWAVITLQEEDACRATVELKCQGKQAVGTDERVLVGSEFEQEGQRRHVIARAFFRAACQVTGNTPPWGMLTGVRPDKPVTWALADGKTPEEARTMPEPYRAQFITANSGVNSSVVVLTAVGRIVFAVFLLAVQM